MGSLNRDAILNADDQRIVRVDTPEWGGHVYVKNLSGNERDEYEQSLLIQRGKNVQTNMRQARAKLVTLATVDEEGNRIFGDGDVKALGEKSAAPLNRIFDQARKLSGLSEEDVEELAGNSESGQSDDSTSA